MSGKMSRAPKAVLILAFSLTPLVWGEAVNSDLKVTSVERTMDMTSQVVKVGTKMTMANNGKTTAASFHLVMDEFAKGKVSYLQVSSSNKKNKALQVTKVSIDGRPELEAYRVDLGKLGIPAGQHITYNVEIVLGKALESYPAEVTQKEKQLVRFRGSHYTFLPYACKTQQTIVTFKSPQIESYTKLKPLSQKDNIITYGPYADIPPFAFDEMILHFESKSPFLLVTNLQRTIEISMWGNIAVEEEVDMRHAGPKLRGSFSRYDFQREGAGPSCIKSFRTVLPASASEVYYRDDIGNVSTSSLRVLKDSVELDLKPRFPLYGGWKTHYMIGYDVPSYEYMYVLSPNKYLLNMRLVDHVFDDMLIEEFELKIILPEGAKVTEMRNPYVVKREKDSLHFTYLDTFGRPTVTVRNFGDLTEKHIQDFQLEFEFPQFTMVREPLLMVMSFLILFLLTIIYVRLDFSITKDEGTEAKLKLSGYCEKIISHQDRVTDCYAAFDDALGKFKTSKDSVAFQNFKNATDYKAETGKIADLNTVLKSLSPDTHDKVQDLLKYDRLYWEQQTNQAALVEKLVSGKLGKQQFIDLESAVVRKKEECTEKINSMIMHLRSI